MKPRTPSHGSNPLFRFGLSGLLVGGVLVVANCGGTTTTSSTTDSGASGSGRRDAGSANDSGASGSGRRDAGSANDSGKAHDTGAAHDSGKTQDSGSPHDSGTVHDSGSSQDTGTAHDSGIAHDTGTAHDSAPPDAKPDSHVADAGHDAGRGGIACNPACEQPGFACCDGACVDVDDDILNCGACGVICTGAHPYCGNGSCGAPPCTGAGCGSADFCCGTQCCTAGQLCCDVPGPVEVGPRCTAPVNGTCPVGCSACVCASPDTPIATPDGDRPIANLVAGDLVYSVDHAAIVAVPLLRVNRTPVHDHHVVRVVLDNGVVLEISPRHPTTDGRTFGDLHAGDLLDRFTIESADLVPYTHEFTYDILPASDTHAYFAGRALIGTTLTDR